MARQDGSFDITKREPGKNLRFLSTNRADFFGSESVTNRCSLGTGEGLDEVGGSQ
jgi:hypothetical protein